MTEREALQKLVRAIGVLTYDKERWFKQNGVWYDRKNREYIQNEVFVDAVIDAVSEALTDRKTELQTCNTCRNHTKMCLVSECHYEPEILIPPQHTGFVPPIKSIKQTERSK